MRKLAILLAVPLGFVVLVLAVFLPPKQRTDAANRENADRIVNALEAYHRASGVYPADLAELVPQFIPQLPTQRSPTGTSSPFTYETLRDSPANPNQRGNQAAGSKGTAYILSYAEASIGPFSSDAAYEYDSRAREWKNHIY